jgi:hypothetical protein
MTSLQDFTVLIKQTETMQALMQSLVEEPTKLLNNICREYETTNNPVPDHHFNLTGYFGEAVLRILLSANLIARETGGGISLYVYKPTEEVLKYYHDMLEEKKDGV